MNKTFLFFALAFVGITAAQAVMMEPPGINVAKVRANGSILVSATGMYEHPECHASEWSFVVPADADPLLKQAVLDAATMGEYVDLQGAGNCHGNIEILKSVTRNNPV